MMVQIEILEKALKAWQEYAQSSPELAPWLEPDLEFAIETARRIATPGPTGMDAEDRDRIAELAGLPGSPGPIGGLAVHDIDDVRVGNLLCDAQQVITRIAREVVKGGQSAL